MSKGLLISFDGVDSSGKETQAKLLAGRFRYNGFTVIELQSPDYSTRSGQQLKKRLQGKLGDWQSTPWQDKMQYFSSNRAEHKEEVIKALDRGHIVIYDRYVPSSLAFIAIEALPPQASQMFRRQVVETLKKEEYLNRGMPEEDVSIFLDVLPRVSAALLKKRKADLKDEDEYTDALQVQRRLYNEYDLMINERPDHFLRIRCVEGTQLLPIDDISELIWQGLTKRFPLLIKKR
jgi:dTMP kinase